jgi:hypothetical protein
VSPSWVPAIACALGLCGSNAFHILATHYIPAAEAIAGGHGVRDAPLQRAASGRVRARVAHLELGFGRVSDRCGRSSIAQRLLGQRERHISI